MGIKSLTEAFPWYRYSKKLISKIQNPHNAGFFTQKESEERNVRLASATEGTPAEGNSITLYWLVDKEDGTIIDARYRLYGQSALIGAAEAACELCVGKNYDQAQRLTAELLDRHLRDKQDTPAFPHETYPHLNLTIDAIDLCAQQCSDLPLPTSYVAPPVPTEPGEVIEGGYPGWGELPLKKKMAVIEQVLDSDVRPYIALDAGGVELLNLIDNREVIITYQGSCTNCYSAVGTTLSYIQQTLRNKVHPDLVVVPDIEFDAPY
ncbi:MAG: iron-sulfur cluster assembly scaffold protein [Chlamydiales bacterium]|nr:iron-sulfur cluster assembly scaffold protein [Chlamydiia bacterium]MCP5507800.1 iron-sulfur cluster assembly scaffold protein [Chlamydiales bacterium]